MCEVGRGEPEESEGCEGVKCRCVSGEVCDMWRGKGRKVRCEEC